MESTIKTPLILGRPFLRSTKARIDMPKEKIRFSFDGRNMTINFNLDKDKQYASGHDYRTLYQKKIYKYLSKEERKQFSRPTTAWKLKKVTLESQGIRSNQLRSSGSAINHRKKSRLSDS
jgi:hypothetical protein